MTFFFLKETSSETLLCERLEQLSLLPSPDQSLYPPDGGSSSEISGSTESSGIADLSKRRDVLNKFLDLSGVENVTQSKKIFSNLTQNIHVSKEAKL